jgi:hypothetical protein
MTDTEHATLATDGEKILWEASPVAQSVYLPFGLSALIAAAGLVLLFAPSLIPFVPGASSEQTLFPGLALVIAGLGLGMVFYRNVLPSETRYQLTGSQLRILSRGKPRRRLVRGEIRLLRCRPNGLLNWARTLGFSGNTTGFAQSGRDGLSGLPDTQRVLALLANWTAGNEAASESSAAEFLADPDGHGREVHEPRWALSFRVPAGWPVEYRRLERRPFTLLGRKLPLNVIHRGALLPLVDDSGEWEAVRVRASDRVGFYLEVSERTGEADLREVRARWKSLGPSQNETETVPIAGFRGVMLEQMPANPTPAASTVQPGREWAAAGHEDEGFGFAAEGAKRILLWATDGEIALQVRAYAPPGDSSTALALERILRSVRRGASPLHHGKSGES